MWTGTGSAWPRVHLGEDSPVVLQRCHAGSWDMHGHGDTCVQEGGAQSSALWHRLAQPWQCPGPGWTKLGAAWGGTEWSLRCSQAQPAWGSITASAPSEEKLPHLHQPAPFPLHSPWLPAGVVWHQKHQLQVWLEHWGLGRLPHCISPPRSSQLGRRAALAQPLHSQLSPEGSNFSGNPGKPFFCLASTGHSLCKVLEDASKGGSQHPH